MTLKRKLADCFENGWLKKEYLWTLRQEIVLGSLYYEDYRNSFGIDEHEVCDFFTSFWDSFCEELAKEDGLMELATKMIDEDYPANYERSEWARRNAISEKYHQLRMERYDNEETLQSWYNCFANNNQENSPLPPNRCGEEK